MKIKAAIIGLCLSLPLAAQDDAVNLPDFGSSAETAASPQEMREYGASMLRQLRAYGYILDDPQMQEYLRTLAFRLVEHSERPGEDYTFFIVREPSVNAFAAPGGYIGVHTGLMLTTESESELAAVLAHEIAHVTQNHLLRAFEDARKNTLPIALAMLGALIAAQNTGGDAAQAAIISGMGLMQQSQINFTRANEHEADRLGIQTLASAGFEPLAMGEFFGRMMRLSFNYGEEGPELLRTHPVNSTRIAEARSRAEGLAVAKGEARDNADARARELSVKRFLSASAASATRHDVQTSDFALMRERARVITFELPEQALGHYRAMEEALDGAQRYGYALALNRAARFGEARALLSELIKREPSRLTLLLALAESEANDSSTRAAGLKRYHDLLRDRPGHKAITMSYVDALLDHPDVARGREAQDLLRPLIVAESDDPSLHALFARAAEAEGDLVRAGESRAEVAFLNGDLDDAMRILDGLAQREDLDYYERSRIDARRAELTPEVLEIRRKHPGGPQRASGLSLSIGPSRDEGAITTGTGAR